MKPITRYIIHLSIGITTYAVGLIALNHYYTPTAPYKYALLLLVVIPIIYTVFTIIRGVSAMDELQRKIIMEAMAFAGIATGFTCFSYLFVRDSGGPEFHAEWAFYIMWFYYAIGAILSARRFQ